MIGKTLAHFEILEKIGSGGMGEVFRARDTRLGRYVALKILQPDPAHDTENIRRFEREARALATLKHPNIVTIYSVEESEGTRFIAMELVEGENLRSRIPGGGMNPKEFYDIVSPLLAAVGAAHQRGLTHRDLKPTNIMVTREGALKVLDFGLAKPAREPVAWNEDDFPTEDVTIDGVLLGTLPYMSPEQVKGVEVDHRSDIFSLGIIFFEMATGRRPFQGETPAELISSILRDRPRLVSDLRREFPVALGHLIERCLEKEIDQRPQSIGDLQRELDAIRSGQAMTSPVRLPSVAVLPFVDTSPGRDQDYFCEGITDELIRDLARVRGLRVASRSAAFRYRNSALDPREIGRQLNVDAVLLGSTRRLENRLRITVELVNVADGYQVWSEHYDRESRDLFSIQSEIAHNIVESLEVTLTPGERESLERAETKDIQAYDYYLRGRRYFYQYLRRGTDMALQMFSLAIKHDPTYARAYAGIADCHSTHFLYADRSQGSLERAEQASARALELDPNLAEAHVSRGQVLSLSQRHEEAEAEFEAALRLGPRLFEAYYLYARDAFAQGKREKAARLYERASEVNPEDYQSPLLVAQIYCDLGLPAEAEAARRRGVKLVEERLKQNPDDVRALYMGANGLIALAERERALEWTGLAHSMEPDEPMVLYNVACIYSMAGKLTEALDTLERAVSRGLSQRGWFENDNNLDPLRSLPGFQALIDRLP
jgi:serine/threonine protein kinase/Tfp pilus assembly protein PilF